MTSPDIAAFTADPRWAPLLHWTVKPSSSGIFLNTEIPPFDNRHVRRAVSFAVDGSTYRAPRTRKESLFSRWWWVKVVEKKGKQKVIVEGNYEVAVDALRVAE